MTTLQENRHRETVNSIARTTAQRDACLDRLVKLEDKLKGLRRQEARQAKALARPKPAPAPTPTPAPKTQPVATPAPAPAYVPGASLASQIDDALAGGEVSAEGAIPAFLDRIGQAKAKDAEARQRIAAEQAATKKAKAAVRIEKLKIGQEKKQARLTGQTRQMPLTGKAALEFIRKGA